MYFIPYLFNHVCIFIGCIDFNSWLGLACIVLFLIFTVHSYVAPTLNKLIYYVLTTSTNAIRNLVRNISFIIWVAQQKYQRFADFLKKN